MQILAARVYQHSDGRKAKLALLREDTDTFIASLEANWKDGAITQKSENPQALVSMLNVLETIYQEFEGFEQTYAMG